MPLFVKNGFSIFFYHVPKTGGSTIEKVLTNAGCSMSLWSNKLHDKKREGFPCSPQHWHAFLISEIIGSVDKSFIVVRHPVDRIVSEYKHRARLMLRAGLELPGFNNWFSKTVESYYKNPYVLDNHIRPQIEFVESGSRIFKLEEGLGKPIDYACSILGIAHPGVGGKTNKGADAPIDIDEKTFGLICKVYENDFTYFGYDIHDSIYL